MKIAAMFLPQFHQDPFNSEWWGDGFTEWTNVRKAVKMVDGQHQPRQPLDGYFDLSDPAEIDRQAAMARCYGISAFSFYDYWYDGRRPLGKPLDILLARPEIDIELSLCWANHSWTRSWTNRTGALDVLIEQSYPEDDAKRVAHFAHLARAFSDPRYIRYERKPVLQIYDSAAVPPGYLDSMRAFFRDRYAMEIHLDAFVTAWRKNWRHLDHYDSCTLFQPSAALYSPLNIFRPSNRDISLSTILRSAPTFIKRMMYFVMDMMPSSVSLFDHADVLQNVYVQFQSSEKSICKTVNPMTLIDFDNTARYGKRAKILANFDISSFQSHLTDLIKTSRNLENIGYVFLNAWNEWGEGAHIQPDVNTKFERLEAIQKALYDAK